MRPQTFDDVVGQQHLIGPGKPLAELVKTGRLPSLILWGPAGTGKTTLAYLLARAVGGEVEQLSAVASGVADARKVMKRARGSMIRVVLFVDEVHRWSKSQQDVLLPAVEEGTITFIGATTENPYFSLVSRCCRDAWCCGSNPWPPRTFASSWNGRWRTPPVGWGTRACRSSPMRWTTWWRSPGVTPGSP